MQLVGEWVECKTFAGCVTIRLHRIPTIYGHEKLRQSQLRLCLLKKMGVCQSFLWCAPFYSGLRDKKLMRGGQRACTGITFTFDLINVLCAEYLYYVWVSTSSFNYWYVRRTFNKPCMNCVVVTSIHKIYYSIGFRENK